MRRTVMGSLASALVLLGATLARGDDAGLAAPKEDEALVRRLLGADDAERAAARKELEAASSERLRAVIGALLDKSLLRPVAPPPPPLPAGFVPVVAPPVPAAHEGIDPVAPLRLMPPPPAPGKVVNVGAWFLKVTPEKARELCGEGLAAGRARSRLVPADELERILARVEACTDVSTVTASRITVYDGQRANLEVLNKVSYIQRFDVERAGDSVVADPVIGQAVEGLWLEFVPDIAEDGKTIEVDLHATAKRLERPFEEEAVPIRGVKEPLRLQRPVSVEHGWQRTVAIPDGGTLLVGGLDSPYLDAPDGGGVVLLLLSVKTEEISAFDAAPAGGPDPIK